MVTGATGFVGQHLIPLLLKINFHFIATTRNLKKASKFSWYKSVKFIETDFVKNKKINIKEDFGLIHLAWQDLPNYDSSFHLEVNFPKSYNFIKSLVERGVSKVLVTGTCFEYGFKSGPIAPTTAPDPQNSYAIAKNRLHKQLHLLSKKNSFCFQWARLFYMYGKGQGKNSIISQLDRAIDNNENIFNMSGGKQIRDYLPVETVAEQLMEIYTGHRSGTYNVCSGNPISVLDLVKRHIKKRGAKLTLNLGHYPYNDYEPMKFWGLKNKNKTN